jgi:FixJ family two-component response regulator
VDLGIVVPTPPVISIVDDDDWAREGIKDLIVSLGYRTLAFASAEEFLESGCVEQTTCVISDLQMPGLSGLDLQQRLKKYEPLPSIIFITAYPDEECRVSALNDGAHDFLIKPIEESVLMQSLHRAVGMPT